ncbi:fatty acid elongase [Strigomonas culicis]|uniref:Elongation of fatty acids protein n=1 Tax=Strigomonas culicis TaxID=28005 RepID=S9VTC2_9TRYP|nr:fatty acid elongase [Strigomonas culicis]|eukprot:EPY30396.1 fatty acid elongase [Strigomonas culicis]
MPIGIAGSFDTSVCVWHPEVYRRGVVGLMCLAFAFSKIPEMFDTVLLVLQKKRFPFLHWYHHTTVMLYCWHAFIVPTPAGVWFATMNFVVHAIMYFYYFLTSCGLTKQLRPFAPLITFLQIAQMAVGTYISIYSYSKYLFGDGCDWTPSNMKLCLLMYTSYAYLFGEFFFKRYIAKPPAASPTTDAKKVKAVAEGRQSGDSVV